jgi:hypothetical protein
MCATEENGAAAVEDFEAFFVSKRFRGDSSRLSAEGMPYAPIRVFRFSPRAALPPCPRQPAPAVRTPALAFRDGR